MPIVQERLLTVLSVAEIASAALNRIQSRAAQILSGDIGSKLEDAIAHAPEPITQSILEETKLELFTLVNFILERNNSLSAENIGDLAKEHAHFNIYKKQNDRQRRYVAIRRLKNNEKPNANERKIARQTVDPELERQINAIAQESEAERKAAAKSIARKAIAEQLAKTQADTEAQAQSESQNPDLASGFGAPQVPTEKFKAQTQNASKNPSQNPASGPNPTSDFTSLYNPPAPKFGGKIF